MPRKVHAEVAEAVVEAEEPAQVSVLAVVARAVCPVVAARALADLARAVEEDQARLLKLGVSGKAAAVVQGVQGVV